MNLTLFKKEVKSSIKLLLILAAIASFYILIIVGMYNEITDAMRELLENMPDLFNMFGMGGIPANIMEYMVEYLYGFILLIVPMIFVIVRADSLICKYVEKGNMAILLAAPIKKEKIVLTQMLVLISGIVVLTFYITILQVIVAACTSPAEFNFGQLILINFGLLSLQLFIGGVCFLTSCIFNQSRLSLGIGAGISFLMFILYMLSMTNDKTE
jgi:ABC-2 type transport system permease protein